MTNTIIVQTGAVTQKAPSGEEIVDGDGVIINPDSGLHDLYYGAALKGSYPSPSYLAGITDEIVAGLTATDGTERVIGNNHLGITVNSITGSGTVVVTGDSINESTNVATLGDTENITIDATGDYQTSKKWHRVTAITIPGGISAINYDLDRLGYFDHGNTDFRTVGFRLEIIPTNATTVTIQIEIFKVQDDGSGKYSLVAMEDITYKGGTAWIVDGQRSTRDYSAASATQFKVGVLSVLKMGDYETHFSSDENILESSTKDEGIIVRLTWANVDFINFWIRCKVGTGL